jgi:hypothetical protein
MLDDRSKKLISDGLPILNFMRIFEGVSSPVFVDDCCHLNDLGIQIFGKAISDEIIFRFLRTPNCK